MKEVKAVKQVWIASLQGAAVLGMATGLLIAGAIIHCASASQVKTLTLSKDFVIDGIRICEYQNGTSFETTQQREYKQCKAVLVVDVG